MQAFSPLLHERNIVTQFLDCLLACFVWLIFENDDRYNLVVKNRCGQIYKGSTKIIYD